MPRNGHRGFGRPRQGLVLALVVMTAMAMAVAAYCALFVALAMARQPGPWDSVRVRARAASETGAMWAKERLYDNAGDMLDLAPGAQQSFDSATEPTLHDAVNGLRVIVTVTNVSAAGASPKYEIHSRAGF